MHEASARIAPQPTPQESAEYTYDMLVGLKEMASNQGQEALVALLTAAAAEAYSLAHGQLEGRAGP